MIVLLIVLLTACSGSSEITLTRAELSSNFYTDKNFASWSIDGDPETYSSSGIETNPWLRVTFESSANVGKVVLVKGWNPGSKCVYQLSVYRGTWKTPCGSFSTAYGRINNISIQCGGLQGDSVLFENYGCNEYIGIGEIKVFSFIINPQTAIANSSQSSNYYSASKFAANAFDGNADTESVTGYNASGWLRGNFATSTEVDRVVINGWTTSSYCVYQVSVLTREEKTPCGGNFTKPYKYFNETVKCGETRGDGIILEQTCPDNEYIKVSEMKIYDYIWQPFINAQTAIANSSQSSNHYPDEKLAANAFDGNADTESVTAYNASGWLRGNFATSTEVDRVVINGWTKSSDCVYQVSVLTREEKTPCGGNFTKVYGYFNETVKCGKTRGDGIILEQTCPQDKYIKVSEMKIYDYNYFHSFISMVTM